jgi:hypothetical protein
LLRVNKLVLVGAVVVAGASSLIPVGGGSAAMRSAPATGAKPPAFADISADAPRKKLDMLFIHHSVGGRLLADPGPKQSVADEIWTSHPDGGGLRRMLEGQGYNVHEASYGSKIADSTDLGDWIGVFGDNMDGVRRCAINDTPLGDGKQNQIVVFKSCFPNNNMNDEKALEKARADLSALLPVLARHPDVLFVYVTTPPLAPKAAKEPVWKWMARVVTGKPQPGPRLLRAGPLSRRLNDWVTSPDGWLKDYPHKNLVVFDYYDVLTDHGKSDYLAFPTHDGYDSHPSREGHALAAAEFVPFLNRAVRRAGLAD